MDAGPKRRSKDDAAKSINLCLQDGRIIVTRHFLRELEKEGLSIVDVHIVIGRGYVFDEPELDAGACEWRYRISGTAPEGQFVNIVFCFNSDEEGVLITIFGDHRS